MKNLIKDSFMVKRNLDYICLEENVKEEGTEKTPLNKKKNGKAKAKGKGKGKGDKERLSEVVEEDGEDGSNDQEGGSKDQLKKNTSSIYENNSMEMSKLSFPNFESEDIEFDGGDTRSVQSSRSKRSNRSRADKYREGNEAADLLSPKSKRENDNFRVNPRKISSEREGGDTDEEEPEEGDTGD